MGSLVVREIFQTINNNESVFPRTKLKLVYKTATLKSCVRSGVLNSLFDDFFQVRVVIIKDAEQIYAFRVSGNIKRIGSPF